MNTEEDRKILTEVRSAIDALNVALDKASAARINVNYSFMAEIGKMNDKLILDGAVRITREVILPC